MVAIAKESTWVSLADASRTLGISHYLIKRLAASGKVRTWTEPGSGRRKYNGLDLVQISESNKKEGE